ncbi:MAG: hypothetical protein FJY88_09905 [Candidatus Eisenbacteria bacterium]|nr:hypothetical protein [Candidatus Eisenbacteria bacterium]
MRAPKWIVPLCIASATVLGLWSARLFAAPSLVVDYEEAGGAAVETGRFRVSGVRCVDTGEIMARQLEGIPGVLRCVVYASRNEALVTYDPARCGPGAIRDAIEGPVFEEASGEIRFQVFRVLSIDGSSLGADSEP